MVGGGLHGSAAGSTWVCCGLGWASSKQLQQEGRDATHEGVQSGWVGFKWVLSSLQWVESMASGSQQGGELGVERELTGVG